MERPTLTPSDGVAALLAALVLGYHLVVTAEPIVGLVLVTWIVALQLAFRTGDREHTAVVLGLGIFVLVGLFSGVLWLYFTNLIVAGVAYTVWALKYAPDRTSSA